VNRPLSIGDPARKGALIVFEGIDGSGKSTQADRLADTLRSKSLIVGLNMEPTDGPHGKALRDLWTSGSRHDVREELELFRLDRMQHVEEQIDPALRRGEVYIIDRYYYSSEAYQGVRGGPDPAQIHEMMTAFAPVPDLTLILDLDPEDGVQRITGSRAETPNALEQLDNLIAVRRVFDEMKYPEIARFDAAQSADALFEQIYSRTLETLSALGLLDPE